MAKSKKTPKVLSPPEKAKNIPSTAQWLAGEGAGSWFVIEVTSSKDQYVIKRLAPDGTLECEGIFKTLNEFDPNEAFEITYPSHCAVVSIRQKKELITFTK